jgi:uncharacterized membrane protein
MIGSSVFPLCFRCIGIYIGAASACFFLLFSGGFTRKLPDFKNALLLGMCTLPLWIDGYGNFLKLWNTIGELRFLTGLLTGFAVPLLLPSAIENPSLKPTIQSYSDVILLLFISFVFAYLLQYYNLVNLLKITLLIGFLFNLLNVVKIIKFLSKNSIKSF